MKIIFLDIDGVLNSIQDSIYYRRQGGDFGYKFSPLACSNVQWLLDKDKDLQIIISSTWRVLHEMNELKEILESNGIDSNRIIGVTPDSNYSLLEGQVRGSQIKHWLDKHNEVTHYVILDDDRDMLKEQLDQFVNTSILHGFMFGDALKAAKILGIDTTDFQGLWY